MRITAVANQKGGVGKSTTAQALAAGIRLNGKNTLIVDADGQGNVSYAFGADTTQATLYDVLRGNVSAAEAIQHKEQGDIIPSSLMLTTADIEFTASKREFLLKEALAPIQGQYDYIIIDTPPALGILTLNALTAATDIVIPLIADIFSLQGLAQFNNTFETVKKHLNPALTVSGLLITRYNDRATLNKGLHQAIQDYAGRIGTKAFTTPIREGVAIREAQATQQDIYNGSKPAQDYLSFVGEYLKT